MVSMVSLEKVCVLCSGASLEKEISHSCGLCIMQALSELGINAELYDWNGDIVDLVNHLRESQPSCVFNMLHGCYGEDGMVQGILDAMKIPYTFSGVASSAIGMNKALQYDLLTKLNFKLPKYVVCNISDLENINFAYPYVAKPIADGSSFGVEYIGCKEDVISYVNKHGSTFADSKIILSEYIDGIELTVGVLNDKALAVTEIEFSDKIFSYEVKYSHGGAVHHLPARVSYDVIERAKRKAENIHESLGCRGATRCDFKYDGKDIYFLEINTQPGMLKGVSLIVEQAEYCGIVYNDLVKAILEQACYG